MKLGGISSLKSSLILGGENVQDLLTLKEVLEKPGIGKYRHDLAESFRGRKDVPLEWIQEWINAEWHIIGHKYLWLAAMNACIGRDDVPLDIIEQGLQKTNPCTFNAAIEACRRRKIPTKTIIRWYNLGNIVLRIAAITACLDNPKIPKQIVEKAARESDVRMQRLAEGILKTRK